MTRPQLTCLLILLAYLFAFAGTLMNQIWLLLPVVIFLIAVLFMNKSLLRHPIIAADEAVALIFLSLILSTALLMLLIVFGGLKLDVLSAPGGTSIYLVYSVLFIVTVVALIVLLMIYRSSKKAPKVEAV